MDCSPPGASVCGILQTRILEWVAMPSSRGSAPPRNHIWVFRTADGFFTAEPPGKPERKVVSTELRILNSCWAQRCMLLCLLIYWVQLCIPPSYQGPVHPVIRKVRIKDWDFLWKTGLSLWVNPWKVLQIFLYSSKQNTKARTLKYPFPSQHLTCLQSVMMGFACSTPLTIPYTLEKKSRSLSLEVSACSL